MVEDGQPYLASCSQRRQLYSQFWFQLAEALLDTRLESQSNSGLFVDGGGCLVRYLINAIFYVVT